MAHREMLNAISEQLTKKTKDKNVILVVPHFKKEDFRYYYTLGMSTNDGEIISNDNKHLTSSIASFYK